MFAAGDHLWDCECEFDSGYILNPVSGLCDVEQCSDGTTFCFAPGVCIDGQDSSSCSCPPGTTGDNCENVDNCYMIDCGQGRCVNLPTSFRCECMPGYSGPRCMVQECTEGVTCMNGGLC